MDNPPPARPTALDSSGIDRPATVAVLLSAASGFVDAFVFVRVYAVFTANQSGNLVLVGIALGEGRWGAALAPGLALIAYVAGAAGAVWLFDRPGDGERRFLRAVATEVAVLGVLALAMAATGAGRAASAEAGPAVLALVVGAAATMGVQAVALRSARGVNLLTTAGTGNMTAIGVGLARARDPGTRPAALPAAGIIGAVVAAYIGGAALGAGAAHLTDAGPVLLVVPILAGVLALALQRRRRRR